MVTTYVIGVLGVVFLLVALLRLAKEHWKVGPASKTWLIIGVIFSAVAVYTWTAT